MSNRVLQKARAFIYRNARPLDFARWQYYFENGSQDAVLAILSVYQNEDGGFGHAIEGDSWNPNSSPIQTWNAIKIIREIGFTDSNHPIMKGILKYLSSGSDFNGYFWYRTVPSNDNYPHAPWWKCDADYNITASYNPTATLVGFVLDYSDKNDFIYETALKIVTEAIDYYMSEKSPEMHLIKCYMELMKYCETIQITNMFNMPEFISKLMKDVESSLERDTTKWENTYCCKPSFFIESKDSMFYRGNEDICEYECDLIIKTQQENGSWKITWLWDDFPTEFAISANWWQSNIIIENLLYLRAFGRL